MRASDRLSAGGPLQRGGSEGASAVRVDTGIAVIFALAVALAFMPALTDRWAARRGASPQTLVALAIVTLAGVVAVPIAFTICTAGAAAGRLARGEPGVAAVVGLLLVAIAAGRTLARVIAIRRRWRAISQVAAALELPAASGAVKVLPVGEPLAFAAGRQAFVSQGLLDHLTASQRRAVIEHEREHARRRHAQLSGAARALAHGAFQIYPARRAAEALDRELDVLADLAAADRVGDPKAVQAALHAVAAATADQADARDEAATLLRIERLQRCRASSRPLVDGAVRMVTLGLGALVLTAICLSIHARTVWLGVAACALLVASLLAFARPVLARRPPPPQMDVAQL